MTYLAGVAEQQAGNSDAAQARFLVNDVASSTR